MLFRSKRSDVEGPTLYPVACSPQAWSAGSVYLLFESCLGISLQPEDNRVTFSQPKMPREIDWLQLNNLRVGSGSVDLRLRRNSGEINVEVSRNEGNCQVQISR